MKIKKILNNGITLISHKLNNTHCVTISVNFKVGSIYESNDNNGITHLVEHLFFREWDTLGQEKLYYEMLTMGAEIIGKTYRDFVSFSITVVPEFFNNAFCLITKCLNRFSWDNQSIILEKKVVCKQIENNYQSFQNWIDSYYFTNTVFERSVMGNIDTIQRLTASEINNWKKTYFCCNNSCVIITGNFTDEDLEKCRINLSLIENTGNSPEKISYIPKNFNRRDYSNRFKIINCDYSNTETTIFFDINKENSYETVRLLSSVLGEGCGSILSKVLREETGLTDDVYTDLMCFNDFYRLSVSFTVNNDDFFVSIRYFFDCLKKCKMHISNNEYNASIRFFTSNQLIDLDNPKILNERYVLCDFVIPVITSEPLALKKQYEKITCENLQICSNRIFTPKSISFLIQTSCNHEKVKSFLEKQVSNLDE